MEGTKKSLTIILDTSYSYYTYTPPKSGWVYAFLRGVSLEMAVKYLAP